MGLPALDFRRLFESNQVRQLVLTPGLQIVAATDDFVHATRKPREAILGRSVFDVLSEVPGGPSGLEVEDDLRASLERVRTQRQQDVVFVRGPSPPLPASPAGTFGERRWRLVNTPIFDASGNLTHILHSIEDRSGQQAGGAETLVSGLQHDGPGEPASCADPRALEAANQRLRREAEALARNEQRLKLLIEVVEQAIFVIDPQGRVASWNAAAERLEGYRAHDVLGRHLSIFFPPESAAAGEPDELLRIAARDGRVESEGWRVRKDGTRFLAHAVITALRSPDGSLHGFAKVIRDVTAQATSAEKALARREADLRLVADAVPALIAFIDPDHHYRYVNRAYEVWFGCKREEVVGKHFRDVLGPAAYEAIKPWVERALSGEAVTFEAEVPYSSGTRWVDAAYTPYFGKTGAVEGLVALVQDVTERKRAERLLAASEERLGQLIEHVPAPVAMLDDRMRYLVVSRRWLSDFRVREAEVIGKSHYDVLPDIPGRWRDIHARCLAGAIEACEEDEWVRADGTIDWVKWEIRPWFDAGGRIGGIVIYCENITERKRTESARRETESRFRALADNIPQLAWMADRTGWIFWYNQRWFDYTGTTLEEMQGWGWKRVHHPDHIERVTERWSRELANGRGWEDTFPLRGTDGRYRWFLSRAVPVHDEHGSVQLWFGTNTDVTRERESQEALQEAVRARDVFLSIASHELKTPLTPLTIQLQGLQRMLTKEGEAVQPLRLNEKLRRADKQVAHLTSLVNSLLDVSRLSEDRLTLDLAPVDLGALAREVVERMRPDLQPGRAPISVRVESVTGAWDRLRLDQAVTNLICNAVKYGLERPIEVEVHGTEAEATLVVRDHGMGIAPDDQERIFGRFERAVSERHYGGFGLGLWISRQVIESMGGRIEVESQLGQGATFRVTLPRSGPGKASA